MFWITTTKGLEMIQNVIKKVRNSEAGMATSEYAGGTVGACGVVLFYFLILDTSKS